MRLCFMFFPLPAVGLLRQAPVIVYIEGSWRTRAHMNKMLELEFGSQRHKLDMLSCGGASWGFAHDRRLHRAIFGVGVSGPMSKAHFANLRSRPA